MVEGEERWMVSMMMAVFFERPAYGFKVSMICCGNVLNGEGIALMRDTFAQALSMMSSMRRAAS